MAQKNADKITVSSSDEKTGIQAISHSQTSPMKSGRVKRVESEYKRNGTTCLIASNKISTDQLNAFTLGQTRKEEDYLRHIQDIVASEPEKEHIIICDQLNTHKSESLVRWVAEKIKHTYDLGSKGKTGILKSQKTRMQFLEMESHKIRFLYTPKHCSWMNQVENWFAKLQRMVINKGEFPSVKDLEEKISSFIEYYSNHLAKPMKWKFKGYNYNT
ncbi:MAG: transposase [Labilibaculum sp.]|nr:transposase [Labilibaculum sp.]